MKQSTIIKDKGRLQSQPFYVFVCLVMLGLLILSALAAVTIGSMDLSIRDVYSVIGYELFHLDSLSAYARGAAHNVVWLIRFPRVVMGLAVGMGLSICGVVMQWVTDGMKEQTDEVAQRLRRLARSTELLASRRFADMKNESSEPQK